MSVSCLIAKKQTRGFSGSPFRFESNERRLGSLGVAAYAVQLAKIPASDLVVPSRQPKGYGHRGFATSNLWVSKAH